MDKNKSTESKKTERISKAQMMEDTLQHISDVSVALGYIEGMLSIASLRHDKTKFSQIDRFVAEFNAAKENGTDFKESSWYKDHITAERHHLNSRCPDDVNLVDVVEMVADCVVAGLARSGKVTEVKIPSEILQKAVANTAKLIETNYIEFHADNK